MTVGKHARESRSDILWEHVSAPGPDLAKFSGSAHTDVAVIGGGIAGLSTAFHLARTGVDVTLLEGAEIGGGASGRSGGLVAPDLVRQSPAEVEAAIGAERAERLVGMIGRSAGFCFELIREQGLVCEGRQNGFWTPAHTPKIAERLLNRAREWQARGFSVRYADAEETAETLGVDRYCGAMVFAEGGTLNPLAFSRGLAEIAVREGARLFARSPVTAMGRYGSGWRLTTPEGVLEAGRVVLAANGGNADLHPGLRATCLPLDVIEYATRPLNEAEQGGILNDDASFTDKQPYVFTARFDADRRLIAAFPDFALRRKRSTLIGEAMTRIRQHFPMLEGVEIQFLWPGRAWINADLLPKVYELGDGAFAVQACNGRGIASNTVLGSELAAALLTEDLSKLSIPPEQPRPIRAYALSRHVPSALMMLAHIRSRLSRLLKH